MIDPWKEIDTNRVSGHAATHLGNHGRIAWTERRHVRGEREHAAEEGSEIDAVAAEAIGIAPP